MYFVIGSTYGAFHHIILVDALGHRTLSEALLIDEYEGDPKSKGFKLGVAQPEALYCRHTRTSMASLKYTLNKIAS